MTDFRHVMTNPQKIPPPARTIPCNELIRQGGPHGDGQRHRTYGKADEGRCGESLLGARLSTTRAINMLLKQAVREQGIPFEVAARPAVGHRAESLEEQNRLTVSTAASSEPFRP